MPNFTVLTDTDVQTLLRTAGPTEIAHFASILTKTLQSYSTTDEATYQPHRSVVTRPTTNQTTLFMPSTTPDNTGVKVVGVPGSAPTGQQQPQQQTKSKLEATLLLTNSTGQSIGLLNAAELTAFRTSLGAMLLYPNRTHVSNLVMFGSGKQAYWHIRLALILRGPSIKTITIVNRSRPRADELISDLNDILTQHSHITVSTIITSDSDPDPSPKADVTTRLQSAIQTANTIHCAVPSTEPLFPASWLMDPSPSPTPYITAIGSYKLSMQELDPVLLQHLTSSPPSPSPPHPVLLVDSQSACFQESGEIVAANLQPAQLLEIGKLEDMRRTSKDSDDNDESDSKKLEPWLRDGMVVYKSVGIGVMDICIGRALLEIAVEKGVGVRVENF